MQAVPVQKPWTEHGEFFKARMDGIDIISPEFGFREFQHVTIKQITRAARNWNAALLSRMDAWADLNRDCGSNAFNTPHTSVSGSGSWCVLALFCWAVSFSHSFVLDPWHTALLQTCSLSGPDARGMGRECWYRQWIIPYRTTRIHSFKGFDVKKSSLSSLWLSRLTHCVTWVKESHPKLSTPGSKFLFECLCVLERQNQSLFKSLPMNFPHL